MFRLAVFLVAVVARFGAYSCHERGTISPAAFVKSCVKTLKGSLTILSLCGFSRISTPASSTSPVIPRPAASKFGASALPNFSTRAASRVGAGLLLSKVMLETVEVAIFFFPFFVATTTPPSSVPSTKVPEVTPLVILSPAFKPSKKV